MPPSVGKAVKRIDNAFQDFDGTRTKQESIDNLSEQRSRDLLDYFEQVVSECRIDGGSNIPYMNGPSVTRIRNALNSMYTTPPAAPVYILNAPPESGKTSAVIQFLQQSSGRRRAFGMSGKTNPETDYFMLLQANFGLNDKDEKRWIQALLCALLLPENNSDDTTSSPAILILDDWEFNQPASLKLVEYLANHSSQFHVVILVNSTEIASELLTVHDNVRPLPGTFVAGTNDDDPHWNLVTEE